MPSEGDKPRRQSGKSRLVTVAYRLATFAIVVAGLIYSSSLAGGGIGTRLLCESAGCSIVASSSLGSTVLAVLLILMLPFFPRRVFSVGGHVVPIWRRFAAMSLDFCVVMTVVAPVVTLPILLSDAQQTGMFLWQVQREFSALSDSVLILSAGAATMLALFAYFYAHPRYGRQTVGQFVLGIAVSRGFAADVEPQYGKRVVLSFVGLCLLPLSLLLALRHPRRSFWWDDATHARVVRTRHH